MDSRTESIGKSRRKDERKPEKKARSRWRKITAAALFLLIPVIGMAAYLEHRDQWTSVQAQIDIMPDIHAKKGTLYEGEKQEVAAGDFWVLINQIPIMREGNRECNIKYENPPANHYSARVSLYSKENGDLLGHTRRVDPGRYVETIQLNQDLPAGMYPVRAVVELFRDKIPEGKLSLDLTLWVLEPEEGGKDGEDP